MDEVLDVINEVIREERGKRVTLDSTLLDADLDSFGITMLFVRLDDEYEYFKKAGLSENDPFGEIPYETITIREIVDTCLL